MVLCGSQRCGAYLCLGVSAIAGYVLVGGSIALYQSFGLLPAALAAAFGIGALIVVVRVVGLIKVLEQTTASANESERRFRLVFE